MAALAPAGSMNKIVLMYCTYRYAALYEISYGRKRTAEVTKGLQGPMRMAKVTGHRLRSQKSC